MAEALKPAGQVLIIGAGSAIARAVLERLLSEQPDLQVVCVSRSVTATDDDRARARVQWLQSDYSEPSIARVVARLEAGQRSFARVFICNGVLHNDSVKPEKRLEELDADALHEVLHGSAVVPMLWLKRLLPLLHGQEPCQVVVFSARVGSIGDNHKGGWYAYRAAKAALNMLVKTASVEYARRAPNVRFTLFHPGTTDTPLSAPFQKRVPAEKLFTPDFVAGQLLEIMRHTPAEPGVTFVDWSGQPVPW